MNVEINPEGTFINGKLVESRLVPANPEGILHIIYRLGNDSEYRLAVRGEDRDRMEDIFLRRLFGVPYLNFDRLDPDRDPVFCIRGYDERDLPIF